MRAAYGLVLVLVYGTASAAPGESNSPVARAKFERNALELLFSSSAELRFPGRNARQQ